MINTAISYGRNGYEHIFLCRDMLGNWNDFFKVLEKIFCKINYDYDSICYDKMLNNWNIRLNLNNSIEYDEIKFDIEKQKIYARNIDSEEFIEIKNRFE